MHPIADRLAMRIVRWAQYRAPDFVIGGHARPYMYRWHVTPWRGWFRDVPEAQRTWWQHAIVWLTRWMPNAYVHCFMRSDDDRALHDHPWLANASWLLFGTYVEHTIADGGIHHRTRCSAGDIVIRLGSAPHRIELTDGECWTLFITGPVVRRWGFHCPDAGWIPWEKFTDASDPGAIGRGCEQQP